MNAACPACGTENGPFAKFCINCIGTLSTTFSATELMPQFGAARKAVRESETMPQASSIPPSPKAPAGPSSGDQGSAAAKKGLWVSVPAFAIACVVGAAGWLFAGAGGTDILGFGSSSSRVAPLPQAQPAAAAAAPSVVLAPPAESPARAVAPQPAPAPPVETAIASGGKSTTVVAPARPSQIAPHVNDTMPPATRPSVAPAKTKPVATMQRDAGLASPESQCGTLSFFAKARCMAQQCASTTYRSHPSCQDVLKQQRLMEEKRNPTMAN